MNVIDSLNIAYDGDRFDLSVNLEPELVLNLLNRKIVRYNRNGGYKWNISGFVSINEKPYVVFPKSMRVEKNEVVDNAKNLLKALYRYRNKTNLTKEELDAFYGDGDTDASTLGLALFFFDDYRTHGLINRNKSEYRVDSRGHICWGKTISSSIPLITKGQAFYDRPYVKTQLHNSQASIRKIHRYVLHDAMIQWGWLDDFEDRKLTVDISGMSLEDMCHILCKELRVTYIYREILLIKNMINYLKSKLGKDSSVIQDYYYTSSFHCVWEKMCGVVLGNSYNRIKTVIPTTSYKFIDSEGNRPNRSLIQIPDILIEYEDDLLVLDAKYYDITGNLPDWPDVMKQYIYRLSIGLNSNINRQKYNNIYNAFLIPQNDEAFKLFAFIDTDGVEEFGKILVYAISINNLLRLYSSNNIQQMLEFRKKLFSNIKNDDVINISHN